MSKSRSLATILMHRKIWVLFLLGFAAGLPLVLVGSTLAAWFTQAGVSLAIIGSLSMLRQPYAYKIAWAPLCDVIRFPFLDIRRSWLLVTQLACIFFLMLMSFFDPNTHFTALIVAGLGVALSSATQDIASSAYLTEACNDEPELRGLGASTYTAGYRVAMIFGGAGSLILSQYIGWQLTYLTASSAMLLGVLGVYLAPAPKATKAGPSENTLAGAFKKLSSSLKEPFERFSPKILLLFAVTILFYKLGDAFTVILNTPFLYALGFSMQEIAVALKTMGMLATLFGGIVGGALMCRMSLFNALLYFGIIQTACNLSYYWLAIIGHSYPLMVTAIFVEYFSTGLGTAAFMALIMYLCNKEYSATQYAFWSAIGALGSIFCGPAAGKLVETVGWVDFYAFCFFAGIPGIVMLFFIKPYLNDKPQKAPRPKR